jgi:hypothetical protein
MGTGRSPHPFLGTSTEKVKKKKLRVSKERFLKM